LTIQRDNSLVIHPVLRVTDKQREIHLKVKTDESEDSIIRRIIGCYLDGYNKIKLTSGGIFTEAQQKAIRHIVSDLYIMIVESEINSITIQVLIDESKASVISGIERMHIITSSMCRDILNSLKNLDKNIVKSVVSLEDDVDQLMFFLLRLIRGVAINPSLANELGLDLLDCLDYQTLVHRIERVADHATNIANSFIALIESQIDIPDEIMIILIKASEIAFTSYDKAVQSFLSKDVTSTNKIIEKQKEIEAFYKRIILLFYTLPVFITEEETSTLSHTISIRESIKKISHYAADIAQLTIDRSYRDLTNTR